MISQAERDWMLKLVQRYKDGCTTCAKLSGGNNSSSKLQRHLVAKHGYYVRPT